RKAGLGDEFLIHSVNERQHLGDGAIEIGWNDATQINLREYLDQIGITIERDVVFFGDGDDSLRKSALSRGDHDGRRVLSLAVSQGDRSLPLWRIRFNIHPYISCSTLSNLKGQVQSRT